MLIFLDLDYRRNFGSISRSLGMRCNHLIEFVSKISFTIAGKVIADLVVCVLSMLS